MEIEHNTDKLVKLRSLSKRGTFRFINSVDIWVKGQPLKNNPNSGCYIFNLKTGDYEWTYYDLEIIPVSTKLVVNGEFWN